MEPAVVAEAIGLIRVAAAADPTVLACFMAQETNANFAGFSAVLMSLAEQVEAHPAKGRAKGRKRKKTRVLTHNEMFQLFLAEFSAALNLYKATQVLGQAEPPRELSFKQLDYTKVLTTEELSTQALELAKIIKNMRSYSDEALIEQARACRSLRKLHISVEKLKPAHLRVKFTNIAVQTTGFTDRTNRKRSAIVRFFEDFPTVERFELGFFKIACFLPEFERYIRKNMDIYAFLRQDKAAVDYKFTGSDGTVAAHTVLERHVLTDDEERQFELDMAEDDEYQGRELRGYAFTIQDLFGYEYSECGKRQREDGGEDDDDDDDEDDEDEDRDMDDDDDDEDEDRDFNPGDEGGASLPPFGTLAI
jgi:hypothetical protein